MQEVVPGIHLWSVFSDEKGYEFNGYAVATSAGTVLIDPPEPENGDWSSTDELAPFEGIYLTNRNHTRAADQFRSRYALAVRAHTADAPSLATPVDEVVQGGEVIAGEVEVVHVPGKSPGEIAFFVPTKSALIVGDVVIGVPAGELSTYPDAVIEDKVELFRSAARLVSFDFTNLLLCDGEAVPSRGKEKLRAFVERQEPSDHSPEASR